MFAKKPSVARLLVFLAAGLTTIIVNAAPGGGNPKGKPFIEVQGQILEVMGAVSSLEDQVESLVSQVDTLEERVDANHDAIGNIQVANAQLASLISANATDVASIQTAIGIVQSNIDSLQQQAAASQGDVSGLEQQIAENTALILNLQSALASIQNGQISLQTDLQAQIDSNKVLIQALQSQINSINSLLALKQAYLQGQCASGYALQAINPDGSIFCTTVSGGSLQTAYAQAQGGSNFGTVGRAHAICPAGYVRTGGGFHVPYFINVVEQKPYGTSGIELGAYNGEHINNVWFVYAFCTALVGP
jgi:peptidoglycan hydrolase CwlO-like protein